ncbi:MAG: hypothetical protein KC501_18045 [Myxococcales bacterium]|nr:hypothetical protein [Myxococcales bacterium]
MPHASLRSFALALSSFALVAGCSDGGGGGGHEYGPIAEPDAGRTLGGELCRLMLEQCDCPRSQEIFGTFAECSQATADQLELYFDEAQAAGLTYHPECMGEHVNLYTQTIQCLTLDELLAGGFGSALSNPPCKVHSGDGQEGDPCTSYYQAMGDTCAQGLQCLDVCTAIPDEVVTRQEGEACDPQTELCATGTACQPPADDPLGATTCVRLPGAGEPCTVGCQEGLNCDLAEGGTERTCLTPPGEGQPCGGFPNDCAAGLYCDDTSTCIRTLAAGSPCDRDEQCGDGMVCDQLEDGGDDVCKTDDPLVCI